MACICCGNDVPTLKLPSHIGDLGACAPCISKHGAEKIAQEADRLLAEWYFLAPPEPICLVCGDPLLINSDGSRDVWCQKCEQKRKEYVRSIA